MQRDQKRQRLMLWLAVAFMLLTAAVHSITLFVTPVAQSETEKQMFTLMTDYKLNLGGGFFRSMSQLTTALSSCFTLLCLLGSFSDIWLLVRRAPADIVKGMLGVQVLVFGACFVIMAALTFLPPIILSGLDFGCLALAYLAIGKSSV